MPEHPQYQDDDIFNPETHHEESDVNVRALIWFFVIFVISAFVIHFALFGLYKVFQKTERSNAGQPLTSMAKPAGPSIPQTEPRLQPFPHQDIPPYRNTPVTDLADMRRAEQEKLTTYGFDPKTGTARIPIKDAKRIVVERGLPVQGAPAPAPVLQPKAEVQP